MMKQISLFFVLLSSFYTYAEKPKITLIFVIDQFPYRYTLQLKKYLRAGFRQFLREGVVFTNAHHVQGMPATCPGHTALNTGAYADIHGVVGNTWYIQDKKVACDADVHGKSPVINPRGGFYEESKSPDAILVDGISDQFALAGTPEEPHATYSIGIKSRAVIATSNKCGTPFWIDTRTGMFTTSIAYVKQLPQWLVTFNEQHPVPATIAWEQKYQETDAYPYGTQSYAYSGPAKPLVGTTITLPITSDPESYEAMLATPYANQRVLDCCSACIDNFFKEHPHGNLLIWACLGSLDKIGHVYGPMSKEAWDMIYWLDYQIQASIAYAEKIVGGGAVLSILTSDHGAPPLPEEMHARGFSNSVRLDAMQLMNEVNSCIEKDFGIHNAVRDLKNNSFYLNSQIHAMPRSIQRKIYKRIQKQLHLSPYIAHAWLPEELATEHGPITTIPYRFHRQYFKGRSGDIIIETRPYVHLTTRKFGLGHLAPYTYNTHVPLMFLWPNQLAPVAIDQQVTMTQLAPTLSAILGVAQPAGAEDGILPVVVPQQMTTASE